ncbi:MAG: hypothetical protein A2Y38_22805 [Spirochaetes bacterium GWB1_59_5]|nr:MAG: hypothetical protein A2Y38_22805 [Spirochaetes bacterium GWB1_59_5]
MPALVEPVPTRYSTGMRRVFFALFILAAAYSFSSTWTSTPTVQVESASLGGLSSLSVRCEIRGASVWLDHQVRGSVPLDLTGLTPGSHLLILRADGYYDAVITLSLAADTKTTVNAALQLRTGFLDIRVDPPSAAVIIDGESWSPGIIELPIGQQTVTVMAFGYQEQSFSVYIPERLFAFITAALTTAPFEVSDFSLSRDRFNPRNAGLKGLAQASFSVTAAGNAELRVVSPEGLTIHQAELGPFDDWDQSYDWHGRGDDGAPVPDGSYTLELTVKPAAGVEYYKESYAYSETLIVDSTLVVMPSGTYGALNGSVHAPEPFAPAADGFRIESLLYAWGLVDDADATGGGGALSASLSLDAGIDAGLGLEFAGPESAAARLGLRLSAPDYGPLGLAVLADGRISDALAGNPAWARLGAALGLGSPFFNIVAMPHFGAYWEGGLSAKAGLGAALTVSGYYLGASLSGSALTEALSGGFVLGWPIKTALEFRFAPPRLPLSFRVVAGLDWSPEPSAWMAGIAISGGF